jgi:hypothetical protein
MRPGFPLTTRDDFRGTVRNALIRPLGVGGGGGASYQFLVIHGPCAVWDRGIKGGTSITRASKR